MLRRLLPSSLTLPLHTRLLCTSPLRLDTSTSRLPPVPAAAAAAGGASSPSSSGQQGAEADSKVVVKEAKKEKDKEKPKGKSKTPPKNRQRPPLAPLDEREVEEEFMRGRGPGGQVINKSSILVSLLHKPTGLRVKCQETRSRETNRLLARRLLRLKVDQHNNGADSRMSQEWERERRKKESRRRKGKKGPSAAGQAAEDVDGVEVESEVIKSKP